MAHVLRYAFKSTQATGQFIASLVFAALAILLLFSTVSRWRYESGLREAIQQVAQQSGDPIPLLDEARASKPDDVLPHLYKAEFLLEKGTKTLQDASGESAADQTAAAKKLLGSAAKTFDAALDKRDLVASGGYDSAAIGACCARLALADAGDAADRPGLLDEAAKALERARSKDDVDVVCAAASLAFARGDYAGCEAKLKDASAGLANAGKGALASYYWHKGLLALMNKDAAALGFLERASILRPSVQCGRAVATALRLAASDDSVKDLKERAEKVQALQDVLMEHTKAGNRWGIDKEEDAATWNSVGVAWTKVHDSEKALNALRRAASAKRDTILYAVNAALATWASLPPDAPDKDKKRVSAESAGSLQGVVMDYTTKRDPKALTDSVASYCKDALWAVVGLHYAAGNYGEARNPLVYLHEKLEFDDREYYRTQGALADWTRRLDLAAPHYREAIKRGHKDSYKMQERIDLFERKR